MSYWDKILFVVTSISISLIIIPGMMFFILREMKIRNDMIYDKIMRDRDEKKDRVKDKLKPKSSPDEFTITK